MKQLMKRKKLKIVCAFFIALIVQNSVNAQSPTDQGKLTFEQFEQKLKAASPNPQILDARTGEEYKLNHLKGAVLADATNEAELQKVIDQLDKKRPVFVYSIGSGRSGALVKRLKGLNFNEAYELPGGISKWVGSGKPVESTTGSGLTMTEYKQLIKSEKLVLVDVHSKFCPGCKKLLPIVDSVATEKSNVLDVVKIELFDNKQLGKELGVDAIPALLLYKGDKLVWKKAGRITKAEIEEAIRTEIALK